MAAYGLLAPGTVFLFLAFLVPLVLIVYTSLQSGGLLSGGFSFTWEFANYSSALSDYGAFYRSPWGSRRPRRSSASWLAYPMAYWIAFYAGRWKSTFFFLILVPFFVSFVIRTVQWKFILARRRPDLRSVEGSGAAAGELPGPADDGSR